MEKNVVMTVTPATGEVSVVSTTEPAASAPVSPDLGEQNRERAEVSANGVDDQAGQVEAAAEEEAPVAEGATAEDAADVKPEGKSKKKTPKPPSNRKLTLDRVLEVREQFARDGVHFSQGNVLKVIGGSYSTLGALMREIEGINNEPFNLEVVVSEATKEAIRADVNRHLEVYRDSIADKLSKVDGAKQALADAANTIKELQALVENLWGSKSMDSPVI